MLDPEEITPSDGVVGDQFGNSVSIMATDVVVGAPYKDDGGEDAGAAYVFHMQAGEVEERAKLTVAGARLLGNSVAISGDTVVVGVGWYSDYTGSAYVFERDLGGPDNWGLAAELNASDGENGDAFGWAVWIDQDTVVIGAHRWDDVAAPDAGAVYVFERDQGGASAWGEVSRLTAVDPVEDANLGSSVAISGDTILAGAACFSAFGPCVESAYVFERDQGGPGNWGETRKLIPSDSNPSQKDRFGICVSLSADTAVVGADQDLCDPAVPDQRCGSTFVFERDLGGVDNWGEATKLTASDAGHLDGFGVAVSVSGDILVIGAWLDLLGGGSAYLFRRDSDDAQSWPEIEKLVRPAGAPARFGVDVAIDQDKVVVGAQDVIATTTEIGAAYWYRTAALFADGFESGDTSAWTSP